MADMTYPLFPIFAFLGFILSLIPLPWHLQAWNSGTCYYMMWAALACLNQFVNSVVWSGNALNPSPIWCEISIRIMMASSVGLPAASLCINRRLYHIAAVQAVTIGHAEKFRAILIDSLICVLFPLIYVALQYVVQGHRFNIFEDIGCFPALYNTLLTYFISNMWPIVIGLISATYCVLSLQAFARRRLEFSQFMNSNTSSLTMGRYFRLMALAMCEILLTTPLAIFTIWLNATASPVGPWRSWEDTHFDYGRVEQIPAVFWRRNHLLVVAMEFTRWVAPLCAIIFFAFFGFADEAKKNYKKAFWFIAKRVGFEPQQTSTARKVPLSLGQFDKPKSTFATSSYTPSSTLPTYSPPPSSLYPMADLKRLDSMTIDHETIRYIADEKDLESYSFSELVSPSEYSHTPHDLTPRSQSSRFSWKSISIPFSSRRHSSYM